MKTLIVLAALIAPLSAQISCKALGSDTGYCTDNVANCPTLLNVGAPLGILVNTCPQSSPICCVTQPPTSGCVGMWVPEGTCKSTLSSISDPTCQSGVVGTCPVGQSCCATSYATPTPCYALNINNGTCSSVVDASCKPTIGSGAGTCPQSVDNPSWCCQKQ